MKISMKNIITKFISSASLSPRNNSSFNKKSSIFFSKNSSKNFNNLNSFNFSSVFNRETYKTTIKSLLDIKNEIHPVLNLENIDKAKSLYKEAFPEVKDNLDLQSVKESVIMISDNLAKFQNYEDAINLLEDFYTKINSNDSGKTYSFSTKEKMKTLIEVNLLISEYQDKLGNLSKAEDYVARNIKYIEDLIIMWRLNSDFLKSENLDLINLEGYLALMHFNMGYYKLRNSKGPESVEEFNKVKEVYEKISKSDLQLVDFMVRKELAKALQYLKKYDEAINIYQSIIKNEKNSENLEKIEKIENFSQNSKNSEKNENFSQISEISQEDMLTNISAYRSLAECYHAINQKNTAENYLLQYKNSTEEYITKHGEQNLPQGKKQFYLEIARAFESVSQDYMNETNFDKSEESIKLSLEYYEKYSKEEVYRIVAIYFLANIYEGKQKYQDSIAMCEKYESIVTQFLNKFFDEEGNLKQNLQFEIPQSVLEFREQVYYLISSDFIKANCFIKLGEMDNAKKNFLIAFNKLKQYEETLLKDKNWLNLVIDLKLKISNGNKLTGNSEECLDDLTWIIQNAENLDFILYAWLTKAQVYCESEKFDEARQTVYDIIAFFKSKEVNLEEEKMNQVYQMLMKVEKAADESKKLQEQKSE
jgi:hypothetical protein